LTKKCSILILMIAIISLGCGKDEVKPSEDSVLAQNALRSIEQIKEAYESKNLGPVSNLTESGLLSRLQKNLNFDKAGLSFSTPRIIKISSSHVNITVNWQGTWELGGVTRKNRGSSSFVFLKDSMQLVQIEGDNPFAVPVMNIK
jgi:hypothetical protein